MVKPKKSIATIDLRDELYELHAENNLLKRRISKISNAVRIERDIRQRVTSRVKAISSELRQAVSTTDALLDPPGKPKSFRKDAVVQIVPGKRDLARQRYAAIAPLLTTESRHAVEARSQETGISPATLYRWLKRYRETGTLSALVPVARGWAKGKSRLEPAVCAIIEEVIRKHYDPLKYGSVAEVVRLVSNKCNQRGLVPPHYNAIASRVRASDRYPR